MTQKQLQYFFAVYKIGNITKAAEQMYVSRPVISRALREIEDFIGITLFERTNDGIIPTPECKVLYNMFDDFQKTYNFTVKKLRNSKLAGETFKLKIGIINGCGMWFYPLLYKPFCDMYPDIQVTVESVKGEDMGEYLSNDIFDILIGPIMGNIQAREFSSMPLYSFQWVACVSKNSVMASHTYVKTEDCADFSVAILDTLPVPFYKYKEALLTTSEPEIVHTVVANGFACAVLPFELCGKWEDVQTIPFLPQLSDLIYIFWNNKVTRSETLDNFLNIAKSADLKPLQDSFGVEWL
ncbi:MAG: LysR family transcriptional regulator [Oscillospiraceae bacterium]|jgi:DNA-binding transcriptional LysR family regulator|nr:LysR family transcriptional regulator [Oscillospiraceae bacterium]